MTAELSEAITFLVITLGVAVISAIAIAWIWVILGSGPD